MKFQIQKIINLTNIIFIKIYKIIFAKNNWNDLLEEAFAGSTKK
jgi:hypothetical protein